MIRIENALRVRWWPAIVFSVLAVLVLIEILVVPPSVDFLYTLDTLGEKEVAKVYIVVPLIVAVFSLQNFARRT